MQIVKDNFRFNESPLKVKNIKQQQIENIKDLRQFAKLNRNTLKSNQGMS
jgi:hypothetical protein